MAYQQDFVALFDEWAPTYDETVHSRDGEYVEVFEGYQAILDRVADTIARRPGELVVDVGTGTGNLARTVLARGYRVIGVEPSAEMRLRAAHVPGLEVRRGDFLSLPVAEASVAAVVSTYAFHHLPEAEKPVALRGLGRALDTEGRIILGDTMFVDEAARDELCRAAEQAGHARLLEDLRTEHYPTIPGLDRAFRSAGFRARFERLNRFVWLAEAARA